MALDHLYHGKRVNDFTLYPYRATPDAPVTWRVLYLVGPNKPNNLYDAYVDETAYGCAESLNLSDWKVLPNAFGTPANRAAFDGYAVWTMCVIDRDEILKSPHFANAAGDMPFHFRLMFYTGVDSQKIQRIGVASYCDGQSPEWARLNDGQYICAADDKYYVTAGRMGWRDPYVVYDDQSHCFVMFVAAKDKNLPHDKNGCIGIATSQNLMDWTVEKPILSPGLYDEMECPVPFKMGGRYYLMSSITDPTLPDDSLRVHYWMADGYLGDYRYMGCLTDTTHYAARVVTDGNNTVMLMHTEWENITDENGITHRTRGQRISDPRIVTQNDDGTLTLSPHRPREMPKAISAPHPRDYFTA